MADNNKAVGPLAAAKLVALIKAALDKKLDKTGGTITGSLKVGGIISTDMSLDLKSGIDAGGSIHSEESLLAPSLGLYNVAKEAFVSIDCSGDNAARITSLSSDGKSHYSRFAVGTPTGDNDAANKAYVDAKVDKTVYVDFWPTSTEDVYDKDLKAYVVDLATSKTFDAIFDSIKAGGKTVARFYDDEAKSKLLASSVGVNLSGDKTLGTINFQFLSAGVTDVAGFPFIGEVITMIKTSSGATSYLFVGNTVLPAPNGDGTDSGKVPTIKGKKWELKSLPSAAPVDTAMSDISTNAVQNKVIKKYVDDHATPDAVLYTAQTLTFEQKQRARNNIEALPVLGATTGGVVSMCPETRIVDSNAAVHIVPTKVDDSDYTLTLDCGPENWPVRVAGIRTPTDAQTNYAANVAYVKAKIAEVAASGGVDVDNALSATSTNPVQNKVVKAALDKKAGTAVATQSINGLMSAADKKKLDGIAAGATKVAIDSTVSGSSNNPVANRVIKQYVDDKVAAAGGNITVDAELNAASTNPVQNKAVKAAIDGKADKTALGAKMDKSGGTFTGNVYGKYFCGTWLQSTAASDLGRTPGKIAVLDDSGWVYYRTPAELFGDLGIANAIKSYVDTAIVAAINSSY